MSTSNLPSLLSASDLEQKIQPLLTPAKIREAMAQNRQSLEQLEGIGRAEMMARDPLGFSGVILGQMSALLPANKAQFYSGQLLSADGKHALIIARIAGSGTDTSKAAQIEKLLEDCRQELTANTDLKDQYILTSVGAYRAALDNETIAKRDTQAGDYSDDTGDCASAYFCFSPSAHRPSGAVAFNRGGDCRFVCLLFFVQVHVDAGGGFWRRDYGFYG